MKTFRSKKLNEIMARRQAKIDQVREARAKKAGKAVKQKAVKQSEK